MCLAGAAQSFNQSIKSFLETFLGSFAMITRILVGRSIFGACSQSHGNGCDNTCSSSSNKPLASPLFFGLEPLADTNLETFCLDAHRFLTVTGPYPFMLLTYMLRCMRPDCSTRLSEP
jgi:hypothetical protein